MPDMATLTLEQILQLAIGHHQANRLNEAEAIYRQVLDRYPEHAPVLYLLGRVLAQRNQLAPAIEAVSKAVRIHPTAADFHNLLGELLRRAGRIDDAAASHARAAQIDPENADAQNGLGNCLRDRGRLPEAVARFRQAIALKPTFAEAHSNLGNGLRAMGQLESSIAAHAQAVRLKPESAEILNNYGIALKEQGHLDQAIAAFEKSVAIRPEYAEVLNNLGSALILRDRFEEAIKAFSRAVQINPDAAEAHNNLGNVLQKKGMLDESVAAYRRALALRPDYAEPHSNLAINLTSQGRLDDAIVSFRSAMACKPDSAQYHGNLLYTLHFHEGYDSPRILEEHQRWNDQFAKPLAAHVSHPNDRSPGRRLRIGYVSPDFRHHPVGRFLLPLYEQHDHERFEVFSYCGVHAPDELTARLQTLSDHWCDTTTLSDAQLADRIRQDRIDILIDLTLHMAFSRLLVFARKPAPVQVTWLGYVSTTGLAAMDYRLSDPYLDPPGEERNYVEQTIRLPHCYWCYEPPEGSPEVGPLPALSTGQMTFGCFNNFSKLTTPTLQTWARILASIPNSRLLLHSHTGTHFDDVRRLFAASGISGDRIQFVGFQPTLEYLRQHHHIDIALDPFPYAGGTTTCDAMWMGVPVVTLAGRTAVGRAGVSLLNTVGLPELIARSPDEYVSIALSLGGNLSALAALRSSLRPRMLRSDLMNAPQFAADMEAAFRRMWVACCAGTRRK
jgi:predicted O-linked N-acetylglucosamine transferase (SPINDLY family)